jgi:hypothetical protein
LGRAIDYNSKDMIPRRLFKRKAIRFLPDQGSLALVDLQEASDDFAPKLMGLVCDESSKGCGVILLETKDLQVGEKCKIQVGQLSPLRAEVRWRKQLDVGVVRLGLLYLE